MKRQTTDNFLQMLTKVLPLVLLLVVIQSVMASNNASPQLDQIIHYHHSESKTILHNDQTSLLSEKSIGQTSTIVLSPNGQVVSGSVIYGLFDLYSITVPEYSTLIISFKLPTDSSSVSVYVKEGSMPTPYHYDYVISSQFSSQTIYPNSSTIPFYITVYGKSSISDYILTASVTTTVPNWIIAVIVVSVIVGILLLLAAFLIPILICLGVFGLLCCAAKTSTEPRPSLDPVNTYYQTKPTTYQKLE